METVEQTSILNTDKKRAQTIYICEPDVDRTKIARLLSQNSNSIRRFIVIDGFNFDNTVITEFHQFLGCQQPEGLRLPSDMTSFGVSPEDRVPKTFELAKKGFGEGVCVIITSETKSMREYIEKYMDEKYHINVQCVEN